MRLKILGCSGGIGGTLRTTSMLLDEDILIDAGTGVGDLSLKEMAKIDHVFVTHSHLDHVTSIPFIVDSVGYMRTKPIVIHATQATQEILKQHLFNWKIWPDFSEIPNKNKPHMRHENISIGITVELEGRRITPLPADHVVPAVGFHLDSGKSSLVFTGDTTSNDSFWVVVNKIENLRYLIIETAFCNREKELAITSKHLCASMLSEELNKLVRNPEIYITHLNPGEADIIMCEVEKCTKKFSPRRLMNNQVFDL
ncbi:MAG: 3',5'-cyclic-nucleotide phosphodiesterase [Proteobacteria bacterium]|nr:3',5'-cyclic-nucleotide phosphodiesterase [Pseudomonadota bacterium]